MVVIYGVHHFRPRRIAFRNDYCLRCGKACRSAQIRTFDVCHIFWIPILPIGFWKRWACTICGRKPHVSPQTRRSFKWACLIVLAVLWAASWIGPVTPDLVAGIWLFRIGAVLCAVLLLVHLLRPPYDPSLEEKLDTVHPAAETLCPFCGTQLIVGTRCYCPGCGVVRC